MHSSLFWPAGYHPLFLFNCMCSYGNPKQSHVEMSFNVLLFQNLRHLCPCFIYVLYPITISIQTNVDINIYLLTMECNAPLNMFIWKGRNIKWQYYYYQYYYNELRATTPFERAQLKWGFAFIFSSREMFSSVENLFSNIKYFNKKDFFLRPRV